MNNFKKNDRFGGGFKRHNQGGFAPRDGDRRDQPFEMHQAVCASCGKTCEVPFKPNGKKPVYCKECFAKNGGPTMDSYERKPYQKPSFDNAHAPRPRFEDRGASAAPAAPNGNNSFLVKEVEKLNAKMDRLITLAEAFVAEVKLDAVDEIGVETEDEADEAVQAFLKPAKAKKAPKKK